MKAKFLILVILLISTFAFGQPPVAKKDSLDYYKFQAEAQFDMVGDYATAIKWMNKAVRLDPMDDELYLQRAFAKGAIYDFRGQEADYSKVIALDAGNMAAYTGRAASRFILKKYRESISDYDWLIDADPSYYGFFLSRGMCKWELKDKIGACNDYRQAAQMGSAIAYVLGMDNCLE